MSVPSAAPQISFEQFIAVDIRVGTIIKAEPFPEARKPALKLFIDFGPVIGVKKSSAQLTKYYAPETLVGRQVAAVVNFPPRQIGPLMSEALTLGFPDAEGAVVLIGPERQVPDGGRMSPRKARSVAPAADCAPRPPPSARCRYDKIVDTVSAD